MKTIAVALVALLTMISFVPAVVRADGPQIAVIDGARDRSPAYVEFFRTFSATLIELLKNVERQTQNLNLAPDHWVILLSPILSTTGETLVTIIAIRGDELEQQVLVAVLSEQSDAATIRTAAKSAHRLIVETATRQLETPSSPPQKLKAKNLRTKTRAEVSISIPRMWYRINYE